MSKAMIFGLLALAAFLLRGYAAKLRAVAEQRVSALSQREVDQYAEG